MLKRKKEEKGIDLGNPIKNITFKLVHKTTEFKNYRGLEAEDVIEMHGVAINIAKRVLGGRVSKWHLTDKGYLLNSHKENLPHQEVVIDIEDIGNMLGFQLLKNAIDGKPIGNASTVHFHDENQMIKELKFDPGAKAIYLYDWTK